MATSKKSSTSKTARVMNLLSKSREDETAEQTVAAETAETAAPAAPHTAPTSPLITSMQADSAISNQVMSALETALDEEVGSQAAPETVAVETVAKAPVAEPVEEPVVKTSTVAAPTAEETAPVETLKNVEAIAEALVEADPEPAPPTRFKVDPETTYVNVMETLVEEKASKYIDMFGLCTCPRCVADVKAYALNHLTPKYVVMRIGEMIPRITVYESQFSASVTAQILNACRTVMNNPRHNQL